MRKLTCDRCRAGTSLIRWFRLNMCLSIESCVIKVVFLAATKQLYEWFSPSVRLSDCLSVTPFDYVPIIVSSRNFQELLPMADVMSMQKFNVKGQGHRGHDPS